MTKRVHGAPVKGFWFEQEVQFIKLEFNATIATTGFGVTDGVLDLALRHLAQRGTILGVSALGDSDTEVDVMLGTSQGWYSAANDGVIFSGTSFTGVDNAGDPITRTCTATFAKFSLLPKVATADMREFPAGQHRPVADYPEV